MALLEADPSPTAGPTPRSVIGHRRTSGSRATMGYQNIGPNYWLGEEGRLGADRAADVKLTDEGGFLRHVRGARHLVSPTWSTGAYQAVAYPRRPEPVHPRPRPPSTPPGSWEIAGFNENAGRLRDGRLPAAPALRAGDLLHQRPHRHRHGRERRQSPNARSGDGPSSSWMTSPEPSPSIYSNALPGFFTLSRPRRSPSTDPLAQEFVSAGADECEFDDPLRRTRSSRAATPNNENELCGTSRRQRAQRRP